MSAVLNVDANTVQVTVSCETFAAITSFLIEAGDIATAHLVKLADQPSSADALADLRRELTVARLRRRLSKLADALAELDLEA